jgi:hypothetical protein
MRPSLFIIIFSIIFATSITFSHPGIDNQLKQLFKGIPIKIPLKGQATWYGQQSMGSCGWWSKNTDYVVALSNQ